jgi:hypothetical protein
MPKALPSDSVAHDASALFVHERELHRRICPALGWDSFRAALKVWELEGFPKVISLTRGRYWPAVKAWLESHYGLRENVRFEEVEDGPENFGGHEHAASRKGARAQARPRP